ncbi:DUF4332 domain-containing protein [Luteolibacter algae]|uniref:DUF4332 domain-containing protein n=1 Tax=Luteolibacter algae TaxID=454151 RepID=A0ABW5D3S6_9BACT
MPTLNEISGIDPSSLELLEAVGIRNAENLAKQDTDFLVSELEKANEVLEITEHTPGRAEVAEWISAAGTLTGGGEVVAAPAPARAPRKVEKSDQEPVNYEGNAEVAAMLAEAPYAVPMPGKKMMEQNLKVSDVPAGILLNRYSGDLDVRIADSDGVEKEPLVVNASKSKAERLRPGAKRPFDPTQVKPMSAIASPAVRVPVSKSGHEEDRVALIRAPREKTNRGKDPNSRRYIRGVLHTHPWSLRFGAVASLLLIIDLPLAIISAILLLLSDQMPETITWVPKWILVFPVALPVLGLLYFIWGFTGKCRICTQKLFVHKAALKHVKAHSLLGMGYVVPLSLHLLLFSWFRCSSCGTPVRLKK